MAPFLGRVVGSAFRTCDSATRGRPWHGILSAMRCAIVAFPLVALAACGGSGGGSDPGPQGQLVSAAARGDVGAVRRLLADGAPVDTRDRDGRTAVTAAALDDHVDVARVLIDAGA